ncbi:hypothetical protein V5O48_009875 [Marasmius crinis-equi]|uniref:Uncharacterized protein n=1 Tax=Marasmius crinis-equi TaxID=585013 RepID=A0ABR3F9Y4_9AGAR
MPISPSVWQSFAELTREDLPILQDVQLSGHLFTYYDPQGFLLTMPTPTPLALLLPKLSSLRTLHISHESVEAVLSLGLKWTFVTHLTLKSRLGDSTHASVVAAIVKSCPSLLSLSLDTTLIHFPREISDSTILSTVPTQRAKIESLTLRLQVGGSRLQADLSRALLATFQGISTPALKDLSIVTESFITRHPSDVVSNSHVGSHMPFHETLARSNCCITHLTIDDFLLANLEALSRSLELLESLISFEYYEGAPYNENPYISNQSDSDYLTPFLRLLAENTSLCPRLERIHLDCEVRHIDAIITFTSSRHRLEHLAADFGLLVAKGDSEDVSSERVKAVVAEWRQARGIQVVWKWHNQPINHGLLDHPWKGIPGAGSDDHYYPAYAPPQREYL